MKKIFNLRKFRELHNLTQVALASAIGVSQSDISIYENNPNLIPFIVALQIVHVYGIPSLDDLLNDEINSEPSITMENMYSLFLERKSRYIEKLNSMFESKHKEFPNIHVLNIYFSSFFLIEKTLLSILSKPTVAFVDVSKNGLDKQNMLSNILGTSTVQDSGIPVFYVDKTSRPDWATNGRIPDERKKDFEWLNDDILYFKKSLQGCFDIKALECLGYASFSYYDMTNDYIDFFLNVKDKKDADCAVMFVESSILKNMNILSISKDMPQFPFYRDTADIDIFIGTDDDLAKVKVKNWKEGSTLKVAIGQGSAQTTDSKIYRYNLFSEKNNMIFNEAFTNTISAYFGERKRNYKSEEKELFLLLEKQLNDAPKKIVTADKNLILSKLKNFANDIKIAILESKNDTISEFEKIYYKETDAKEIEKILVNLGSKTYGNSEEKDSFPCNRNDLEKAKEVLFESFINAVQEMFRKKLIENFQKDIDIIEKYKNEDGLYTLVQFEKGLQKSLDDLNDTEEERYAVYHVANIFLSIFNFNIKSWGENTEEPMQEVFYGALESISTFARGFSLSKARKISKALQDFSNYKSFTQILDSFWNNYDSYMAQLTKMCANDDVLDALPRSEEDLNNLKQERESQIKTIEEIQKFCESEMA